MSAKNRVRVEPTPSNTEGPVIQIPSTISTSPRRMRSEDGKETILMRVRPGSHNVMDSNSNSTSSNTQESEEAALHIFPELIGKGKFGEVFRAQLDDTGGTVLAVKRVKISSAMPERTRQKCFNEVALLKKLSHKHIVGCYDSFFDSSTQELIIILEMVPGGDQRDMIKALQAKKRRFTEKRLWVTLRDQASALDYMHGKRIMHRDLKSANVLMGKDGAAKLADFGLGLLVSGEGTLEAVSKVGTPLYMPPEILRGETYGVKADMYSLGCILYEMIRFVSPFQYITEKQASMMQQFDAIKGGKFQILDTSVHKYSSLVCNLVMRQLHTRPEERPSAREVWGIASCVAEIVTNTGQVPSDEEVERLYMQWELDTPKQNSTSHTPQEPHSNPADFIGAPTELLARSCGVIVMENASNQHLQRSIRQDVGENVHLVGTTDVKSNATTASPPLEEGKPGEFVEYYPIQQNHLNLQGEPNVWAHGSPLHNMPTTTTITTTTTNVYNQNSIKQYNSPPQLNLPLPPSSHQDTPMKYNSPSMNTATTHPTTTTTTVLVNSNNNIYSSMGHINNTSPSSNNFHGSSASNINIMTNNNAIPRILTRTGTHRSQMQRSMVYNTPSSSNQSPWQQQQSQQQQQQQQQLQQSSQYITNSSYNNTPYTQLPVLRTTARQNNLPRPQPTPSSTMRNINQGMQSSHYSNTQQREAPHMLTPIPHRQAPVAAKNVPAPPNSAPPLVRYKRRTQ